MRKLLNTLYVTTPDAYLSKDGQNVVVSVKQEERFRIPIINIEGIVTFGYQGASPGLMRLCSDHQVSLTFLSPNGSYIGHFQGKTQGNVLLRKSQYAFSESELSLHLASIFIGGKIQNYRSILQRFMRDYGNDPQVESVCESLAIAKRKALYVKDKDALRGVEGDAANAYFQILNRLIIHQKESFSIQGRNRRPPKDPTNAMLSFVYTLLANECTAALESVGLDPYVGFLHTVRPGRCSLALDLMEELRAYLGDRLVLSLINRKQITIQDFIIQGDQAVTLTDSGRKTVLSAWQNRKKETLEHPYLHEKVPVGLLPYIQSMLLARYLRKDIDDYPVFLVR